MRRLNLLLVLALLTAHTLADPRPEDFAYSYTIKTPTGSAIYELPIPEAIYAKVVQADLSDIAVFNADNETVPHAFLRAIQPEPVIPAPVTLPLFPVAATQAQLTQGLTLKLLTDFSDAVIELQQQNTNPSSVVNSYIVDISKRTSTIKSLQVVWQPGKITTVTQIRVETSDDLSHWRKLVSGATLAQLRYAGNTFIRDTIEIPREQGKYLKIHWPAGSDGALIQSVRAQFYAGKNTPTWQHNIYPGKPADDAQSFGFDYEIPAYLPIRQIRVNLEQTNSLLQGRIYSRSAPDQAWHLRHRGLHYRLQFPVTDLDSPMAGQQHRLLLPAAVLDSPAINVPLTTDRFWRVEYDRDRSSLGSDIPALEFGWQTDPLVFLARGKAPFTLAYGSARVKTRQAPVARLLDDIKQAFATLPVTYASLGEAHPPGSSAVLLPQPPPLPWRNWLLWASLIGAVLVLAILAWRLHRQIKGRE
ncbi:hypothetical protein MNBD_GAMMA13-1117 [hydrothermal vent metagenome]|uniref:DUF3999 domain-containing protein n=1 Tax=hydrothermal vent metagenome TaxID=652676 RepID=A0A3B0YM65_9ZZZZ